MRTLQFTEAPINLPKYLRLFQKNRSPNDLPICNDFANYCCCQRRRQAHIHQSLYSCVYWTSQNRHHSVIKPANLWPRRDYKQFEWPVPSKLISSWGEYQRMVYNLIIVLFWKHSQPGEPFQSDSKNCKKFLVWLLTFCCYANMLRLNFYKAPNTFKGFFTWHTFNKRSVYFCVIE